MAKQPRTRSYFPKTTASPIVSGRRRPLVSGIMEMRPEVVTPAIPNTTGVELDPTDRPRMCSADRNIMYHINEEYPPR